MKRLFGLIVATGFACATAFGQQYKVLYSFQGTQFGDGANPVSSLVMDSVGNLYGTTKAGGSVGSGSIFELSPNSGGTWMESVIYSFCANSECPAGGASPEAGLSIDANGNLYGTASEGGNGVCPRGVGTCGVVFELSPPLPPSGSWTETVLYNFCSVVTGNNCDDGSTPASRVRLDSAGNIYGTTPAGGTGYGWEGQNGTVFELSPSSDGTWQFTTLYNFCPKTQGTKFCPDGSMPLAGVSLDKFGNLYGTTGAGGVPNSGGGGTVYKLSPGSNGWTESILYAFRLPFSGGAGPVGEVVLDGEGNIYSTTEFYGLGGEGTAFKLQPNGKGVSFFFNGVNGGAPAAGLTLDGKKRLLYGTATKGILTNPAGGVYQISPSGQLTWLYTFCSQSGCSDGEVPLASLFEDASGNLYGTTEQGGVNNNGVVFEITP